MKRYPAALEVWLLLLLACAALAAFSFARIDVPAALYFWKFGRFLSPLNRAFATPLILSVESLVILILLLARLMRGHISRISEATAIACLTSICTYGVNSLVLKVFFGVPTPYAVVHGARHVFHWWKGAASCSFPSGHMMLAGAFAGVFMRLYRTTVWPLAALLLLAAALLVVGDWHFPSDVIAGTFLGVSAGVLGGEGWAVHWGPRS